MAENEIPAAGEAPETEESTQDQSNATQVNATIHAENWSPSASESANEESASSSEPSRDREGAVAEEPLADAPGSDESANVESGSDSGGAIQME
ncbi:MAG TPA: hypothetical protein PLZ95_15990, partial [Bryobacteraceae bacterium]|nr:hypothetical protein [Bryobacteraceae bacterium]